MFLCSVYSSSKGLTSWSVLCSSSGMLASRVFQVESIACVPVVSALKPDGKPMERIWLTNSIFLWDPTLCCCFGKCFCKTYLKAWAPSECMTKLPLLTRLRRPLTRTSFTDSGGGLDVGANSFGGCTAKCTRPPPRFRCPSTLTYVKKYLHVLASKALVWYFANIGFPGDTWNDRMPWASISKSPMTATSACRRLVTTRPTASHPTSASAARSSTAVALILSEFV